MSVAEGDWVYVTIYPYKRVLGWIARIGDGLMVDVYVPKDNVIWATYRTSVVLAEPILTTDDVNSMIDLSLVLHDKKWFLDLTQR